MDIPQKSSQSFLGFGRWPERILIGGQLDGGTPQLTLDFFDGLAGGIRADASRPGREDIQNG